MQRSLLAVLVLALATAPLGAAPDGPPATKPPCGTVVPAGLVLNQTWTKAGSPYCVQGDVQVSLLTIEPGVTVCVDDGFEIQVLAALTAVGTAAEPIVFTVADPSTQRWEGLVFQNTPPGTTLQHCVIEHSDLSGMRITDSSPTIEDCVIRDCSTPGGGGAILASLASGDLELTRCLIYDNTSDQDGGGIRATMTAGVLRITESAVCRNTANPADSTRNAAGGGLYVVGSAELANVLVCENMARSGVRSTSQNGVAVGGGLRIDGSATLSACFLADNRSVSTYYSGSFTTRNAYGGGLYLAIGTTTLENCIVAGNQAQASSTRQGAGLYQASGSVSLVNTTVARNGTATGILTTGVQVAGGTFTAINSILYFNNGDPTLPAPVYGPQTNDTAAITLDYSDVQNGICASCSGANDLNFTPVFAGTGTQLQDLAIVPGSPVMDQGDPDPAYDDVCFPPSLAIGGVRNDMGAHGGPGACGWQLDGAGVAWPVLQVGSATWTTRNGGSNPNVYSTVCRPVVGTTWKGTVVKAPGERWLIAVFLGGPRPALALSIGALLCQPPLLGSVLSAGDEISLALPGQPELVGSTFCTQGALFTSLADLRLTNALDLRLGSF